MIAMEFFFKSKDEADAAAQKHGGKVFDIRLMPRPQTYPVVHWEYFASNTPYMVRYTDPCSTVCACHPGCTKWDDEFRKVVHVGAAK